MVEIKVISPENTVGLTATRNRKEFERNQYTAAKEFKTYEPEKKSKKGISKKMIKKVDKLLGKKIKSTPITRSQQATVVIDEPVALKDKSRFFKKEWTREEKRFLR